MAIIKPITTPDTFQPIGAVAANVATSIPVNPDYVFRNISVYYVRHLARQIAKKAVQEELRAQGARVSLVPTREIAELAVDYLASHPEVWKLALARAHQIDEAEGEKKARQKLRREQRRKIRPPMITPDPSVYYTGNDKTGTDKSG